MVSLMRSRSAPLPGAPCGSSVIEPSIACMAPALLSVPSTEPKPTGASVENCAAGPSAKGTLNTTDGWPRYE